jgi:CNT family concentrative nucleoside transporter
MIHIFRVLITVLFGISTIVAQDLEKTWQFETIEDAKGQSLFKLSKTDTLSLTNGSFHYSLKAKNNLKASGDYLYQNNLLVFYYSQPTDTIRYYRIKELTDSTLVFKENGVSYKFKPFNNVIQVDNTIIPSQGFSIQSLMRGAIGMLVLLLLAIILSKNRKAINWRTVGFGLLAQLILAISVLKIPFVQASFEWVGKRFIDVLDFTMAGTKFLFAAFSTNEIDQALTTFAVSILPTIIFFSALTSVLFYLGIIQKVVKGMAWLLTKLLRISGAESFKRGR